MSQDHLGHSVAISEDYAIVGAYSADIGSSNSDEGATYIFKRLGTTWEQQVKITALDSVIGDLFGNSVAISGGVAIVGAFSANIGSNSDQGAAYIVERN
jgi:hypothetical protein